MEPRKIRFDSRLRSSLLAAADPIPEKFYRSEEFKESRKTAKPLLFVLFAYIRASCDKC
jgi:hypothetical protein